MKKFACVALIGLLSFLVLARMGAATEFVIYTSPIPRQIEPENDGVKGFYADVIQLLAVETKDRFRWEFQPWARTKKSAEDASDGLVLPITRTSRHEAEYQWIARVGYAESAIFFKASRGLKSLDDLRPLRIGYLNGTGGAQLLSGLGFTNIEPAPSNTLNARKLKNDHIDGWEVNRRTGPTFYAAEGFDLSDLGMIPLDNKIEQWICASQKVRKEDVERLSAGLAKLRNDGTLARLEAKWN